MSMKIDKNIPKKEGKSKNCIIFNEFDIIESSIWKYALAILIR